MVRKHMHTNQPYDVIIGHTNIYKVSAHIVERSWLAPVLLILFETRCRICSCQTVHMISCLCPVYLLGKTVPTYYVAPPSIRGVFIIEPMPLSSRTPISGGGEFPPGYYSDLSLVVGTMLLVRRSRLMAPAISNRRGRAIPPS